MIGKKYKGFSLIEILVVVALIIILATITIVAINPAKNFRDTRNAQRSADVMQILNAVTQYTSEQGHALADLGTIATCPTATTIGTAVGNVDLGLTLVDEYIVAIPMDPSTGTAGATGYTICQTGSGRIEVTGNAEVAPGDPARLITVKR